jgi:hypothetical protein
LSGATNLESESKRLQAVAFINKPVNIDLLIETVTQYC